MDLKTRKHYKLDIETGEKVLLYIELIKENDNNGLGALFGN
tara:strand:- start:201 stop:323 length:123 start_codon:yes stop_codon:yes gene_type:complete